MVDNDKIKLLKTHSVKLPIDGHDFNEDVLKIITESHYTNSIEDNRWLALHYDEFDEVLKDFIREKLVQDISPIMGSLHKIDSAFLKELMHEFDMKKKYAQAEKMLKEAAKSKNMKLLEVLLDGYGEKKLAKFLEDKDSDKFMLAISEKHTGILNVFKEMKMFVISAMDEENTTATLLKKKDDAHSFTS